MSQFKAHSRLIYLVQGLLLLTGFISGSTAYADKPLVLNDLETSWLQEHPVIRVAPDPDFAPVEWFNHVGDYQGMTADYIQLLEKKLAVRFEVVEAKNWKSVLEMARRKQVDVLTAIARTPQRESYLNFTEPYLSMKGAIFSNRELPAIKSLADLKGYRVAVVEGYLWDDLLTPFVDVISINRFHDLQTALISTSREVTDITVGLYVAALFAIKEEGLHDLEVVTTLPQKVDLNFAVRKDWLPLTAILNRALASITPAQHAAIRKKWVDEDIHSYWKNPIYRYTVLVIFALLLLTVFIVIGWNRMLNSRVRKRSRELKDAQTQLIHAEKMESIGRLAAGVAHEVKNPLAIIQMGADFLSHEIPADETSRAVIKDIDDAVLRADIVIKGLLDFSRDKELELKPGSLNEVVERTLQLVAHEMRQRNIDVSAQLTEDIPDIYLDSNKLQQVLINLLMNSAQAIERDGELSITTDVRIVTGSDLNFDHENRFTKGEQVLWLEVNDNGPGIPEQDRQRIFDPFYTTKPVGEGTGLGLSVTRNIINLHNASIDIHNRVEGGASVVLMFKLNSGERK